MSFGVTPDKQNTALQDLKAKSSIFKDLTHPLSSWKTFGANIYNIYHNVY